MKTILIVSYYFPPYGGGGIIRVHNFVKYLPKFGFKPLILTLKEDYYEKTYFIPELLDEYPKEIKIIRTDCLEPKGGKIKDKVYGLQRKDFWDNLFLPFAKNTVNRILIPDRNILWTPFSLLAGRKIFEREKFDLIFSTSPPFSSNVIAYLLCKLTGKPFIIDYRDDWIGNEFYSLNSGHLRFKIEKQIESVLLKNAARVVTSTNESVALFRKKYPQIEESKYRYIPNGYDPEYFKDRYSRIPFEENPHGQRKINFVHTGSLTVQRDPRFFLEAVKGVLEENPSVKDKIKITFIGFTHYKHKELVGLLGLGEIVSFQESMSPKQVAQFLQDETNVCLIFQRNSEGGQTAIPGKLYEYFAARKPILCMDDQGATTKFLEKLGCRLNTKYEHIRGIAYLIKTIIHNYQQVRKNYFRSTSFIENFSRQKQTEGLAKIFNEVLG